MIVHELDKAGYNIMKINKYLYVKIQCPPCHKCEHIKLLCMLSGFKEKEIINSDEIEKENFTYINIKPVQFEDELLWKININFNHQYSNFTNISYDSTNSFSLPLQEKEFLMFITELQNIFLNEMSHKNFKNNRINTFFTKSNYEKQIIIISSTNENNSNSFLCIELAKFLAENNKKVQVIDCSSKNEISTLLSLTYKFDLYEMLKNKNINYRSLFENNTVFKINTSNENIYFCGNKTIGNFPNLTINFIENIYRQVDYIIINTGIYKEKLNTLYQRYNHILICENNLLDIIFLENILENIKNLNCIISFSKNTDILGRLSNIIHKPLIIFKPIKFKESYNILNTIFINPNYNKNEKTTIPKLKSDILKIKKIKNEQYFANSEIDIIKTLFNTRNKKEKIFKHICKFV